MDILLADKAAEMVGLKSKFADTGNNPAAGAGKAVWAVISVFCLVFAMWHAYNANKCEKQGSKLILSLILSFLFPKIATVYYAMKYKAMPWGADKNTRLIERYYGARAGEWDMKKCAEWIERAKTGLDMPEGLPARQAMREVDKQVPGLNLADIEGGRGNMFGGWAE